MTYTRMHMLQTFENINSKFPIKIDFKTKSFTMYTISAIPAHSIENAMCIGILLIYNMISNTYSQLIKKNPFSILKT